MTEEKPCTQITRRRAVRLLAGGASLGALATLAGESVMAEQAAWLSTSSERPTFPSGAIIRTILKDVPPDTLGTGATLFHEHVMGSYATPPASPQQAAAGDVVPDLKLIADELRESAQDGLVCIVDSAIGPRSRQAIENLTQVATRSGVNIVMAGGYYLSASYPDEIKAMGEEQLATQLVRDAGAQRWGAFGEIGFSKPPDDQERKMLRSVAKAHLRTGIPIFTHTPHESCPQCALEQLTILIAAGVDPRHVVIGHLSSFQEAHDPGYRTQKELGRMGAFLGFDTVGHEMMSSQIPESQKVRMVLTALDAGYENQVLLSGDFAQARQLKANWGTGFATTLVQFVPKLRYAGVTDKVLHKILVDNPRRFLSFVPKQQ